MYMGTVPSEDQIRVSKEEWAAHGEPIPDGWVWEWCSADCGQLVWTPPGYGEVADRLVDGLVEEAVSGALEEGQRLVLSPSVLVACTEECAAVLRADPRFDCPGCSDCGGSSPAFLEVSVDRDDLVAVDRLSSGLSEGSDSEISGIGDGPDGRSV